MQRGEGRGVGNGLDKRHGNTIDVAIELLVVLAPQIEQDDGCRRQGQD